ncbi:hypothetical protein L208DRAFT_564223 [Tricholoma matsutake]|nr:hypothetical protein L208DRAFT_564223 [Tricholoma matsutake 945]
MCRASYRSLSDKDRGNRSLLFYNHGSNRLYSSVNFCKVGKRPCTQTLTPFHRTWPSILPAVLLLHKSHSFGTSSASLRFPDALISVVIPRSICTRLQPSTITIEIVKIPIARKARMVGGEALGENCGTGLSVGEALVLGGDVSDAIQEHVGD